MEHDDPIPWTEEQWAQVQETVRDEAGKVRVAASFLPIYGPLPRDTESVPLQIVNQEDTGETTQLAQLATFLRNQSLNPAPILNPSGGNMAFGDFLDSLADQVGEVSHSASRRRGESRERLTVDDTRTRPLTKISVNVYLRSAQVQQPDLSSALLMFRRAANIIARVEDSIVFRGQPRSNPEPEDIGVQPPIFRVSRGEQFLGLIESASSIQNCIPVGIPNGNQLVGFVVQAIRRLEDRGHLAPFALVLGPDLFTAAYSPDPNSLVLPADRITPMLNGPLLRSSTIAPREGVLVSLAGDLVDLVVASDITAQFTQVTLEPRYVFRVSTRFTLRVKEPNALMALLPNCP